MRWYMFVPCVPLFYEIYVCVDKGIGRWRARGGPRELTELGVFKQGGSRSHGTLMALAIGATVAVAGPAAGQKIPDRHPDMVRAEVRPLTFEERWEPVRGLLARQAFGVLVSEPPRPQNAPASPAVDPVPVPRVRTVMVTIRKPDQETCRRHGRRTVWNGNSWRCRR
jgi:hypothetical protein